MKLYGDTEPELKKGYVKFWFGSAFLFIIYLFYLFVAFVWFAKLLRLA